MRVGKEFFAGVSRSVGAGPEDVGLGEVEARTTRARAPSVCVCVCVCVCVAENESEGGVMFQRRHRDACGWCV